MKSAIIGGTAIALAASLAYAAAPRSAAPASRGAQLFATIGCGECHGYAGQGGNAGPRLAGKHYTPEILQVFLRRPAKEMPPYSAKVVSDADVAELSAYIATLK